MTMYDNYSPLDLSEHPFSNAIFNYEFNRQRWPKGFKVEDIRRDDWGLIWKVFWTQVALVFAVVTSSSDSSVISEVLWLLVPALVCVVPFAVSVIVDLRMVNATVAFWHARAKAEVVDVLRLTVPTDEQLITSLRAIIELSVWRGMRWEMGLRSFFAFGAIMLAFVFDILLMGLSDKVAAWVTLLMPFWIFRVMMLYLREPLWRMRVLVAMSIAIACRVHETNGAILTASALALGFKLVQVTGIVVLTMVFLLTMMYINLAVDQTAQYFLMPIWWIVSGLLITRVVRKLYALLHGWFTRQALRTMQGLGD